MFYMPNFYLMVLLLRCVFPLFWTYLLYYTASCQQRYLINSFIMSHNDHLQNIAVGESSKIKKQRRRKVTNALLTEPIMIASIV